MVLDDVHFTDNQPHITAWGDVESPDSPWGGLAGFVFGINSEDKAFTIFPPGTPLTDISEHCREYIEYEPLHHGARPPLHSPGLQDVMFWVIDGPSTCFTTANPYGEISTAIAKGLVMLPDGVTPEAAGPIPAGAVIPDWQPESKIGYYEKPARTFVSPAGNVGCYFESADVVCDFKNPTWESETRTTTLELGGILVSYWFPDWAENIWWDNAVVGDIGTTYTDGEYNACYLEASGVTCWNAITGHGFKGITSELIYW